MFVRLVPLSLPQVPLIKAKLFVDVLAGGVPHAASAPYGHHAGRNRKGRTLAIDISIGAANGAGGCNADPSHVPCIESFIWGSHCSHFIVVAPCASYRAFKATQPLDGSVAADPAH